MRLALAVVLVIHAGCADCGRPLEIEEVDLAAKDLTAVTDLATTSDASAAVDFGVDLAAPELGSDASMARTWQAATQLVVMGMSYAPAVAMNETGQALVAWRVNGQNGSGAVAASRFDVTAQTWGAVESVPLSPMILSPLYAGLDDTGQAALYQCSTPAELAAFEPVTASWSKQTLPAPPNNMYCAQPVAMPSSSRMIGLWFRSSSPSGLWTGRYDLFGWTQLHELDAESVAVIDSRAIHGSQNGHIAALWRGYYPTIQLRSALFDPMSQTWTAPLRLDDGSTTPSAASVAVDRAGNALAVWDDASLGKTGTIWARRYDAAAQTWGPQQSIGSGGAGPQVALSASGTAIVLFGTDAPGAQRSATARLKWARYVGGAWEAPADLLLGPAGAGDAHVAMNSAGEAVAAWVVVDGVGGLSIWVSRLE